MPRKTVLKTISMIPELLDSAKERSENLGMGLSTYIQNLIKSDIMKGGRLEIVPDKEFEEKQSAKKSSK